MAAFDALFRPRPVADALALLILAFGAPIAPSASKGKAKTVIADMPLFYVDSMMASLCVRAADTPPR